MKKQMALCALVTGVWLGLSPGYAHALRFGREDKIRQLQPTRDPDIWLCHRVRTYHFLAGVYMADEGYVLQKTIRGSRLALPGYHPLDDEKIRELQQEGVLPTPLPAYSLSFWDYFWGYLLWIVLAGVTGSSFIAAAWAKARGKPDQVPPDDGGEPSQK